MPVPLKASGSVTLVDDTGKTILKVSASGKASKGVFTLDNNSTVPMVGNATGACTDDADKKIYDTNSFWSISRSLFQPWLGAPWQSKSNGKEIAGFTTQTSNTIIGGITIRQTRSAPLDRCYADTNLLLPGASTMHTAEGMCRLEGMWRALHNHNMCCSKDKIKQRCSIIVLKQKRIYRLL